MLPSFYWWNLQDQLLLWLNDTDRSSAIESFHAKLANKNEYWQLHQPYAWNGDDDHTSIALTSDERCAQPLIQFLQARGPHHLVYFDSQEPLQQLTQWCESSLLFTKIQNLLKSEPTQKPVSIWWCGGLLARQDLEHVRQQLSVRLTETLSHLYKTHPITLGWYTTLADVEQWQLLRSLGFENLLAPPFRIRSLST
jgi:hypothetical protein